MKNARKHAAAVRRLTETAPAPRKGRPAHDAAPGAYIVPGVPFDADNAAAVYAVAVRAAAGKNKWMYQKYARPENLLNWYAAAAVRARMDNAADFDRNDLDAARAAALDAGDVDAARRAGENLIAALADAVNTSRAAALDAHGDAAARLADAAARLAKNPGDVDARRARDDARADMDAAAVKLSALDAAAPLAETVTRYRTRKTRADYYTASGRKIKVETGDTITTEYTAETLTGDTLPAVFEHIHAAALYIIGRRPRTVAAAYIAANKGITRYCNQYDRRQNHDNRTKAAAAEKAAADARAARAVDLWGLSAADAAEYAARPGFIGGRDTKGGTPRPAWDIVSLDTFTDAAPDAVGDYAAARADADNAAAVPFAVAAGMIDGDNAAADIDAAPVVDFAAPAGDVDGDAAAVLAYLDRARRLTAGQYAAARAVVLLSGAVPGGRGDAVRPVDVATAWIDAPETAPAYAVDLMHKYAGDAAAVRARIARRVAADLSALAKIPGLHEFLTDAAAHDAAPRKGRPAPAPALTPAAVRDAVSRIDAGEKSNARPVKLSARPRPSVMPAPRAAAARIDAARAADARRADAAARIAAHDAAENPTDAARRADAARAGIDASRAAYAAAPGVKWTTPRPAWAYVNNAPGVDARTVRDAAADARDDARRAAAAARRARRVETAADVRAARFAEWLTDVKGMDKDAAARFAARAVARGEIV